MVVNFGKGCQYKAFSEGAIGFQFLLKITSVYLKMSGLYPGQNQYRFQLLEAVCDERLQTSRKLLS